MPYIFEASVERLELLPGELGLGLELVEALWLVPHRGELKVTVTGVCRTESDKTGGGQQKEKREKTAVRPERKKKKKGRKERLREEGKTLENQNEKKHPPSFRKHNRKLRTMVEREEKRDEEMDEKQSGIRQ